MRGNLAIRASLVQRAPCLACQIHTLPRTTVPEQSPVDVANDITFAAQGILANLIHETFNIPTGFHGTLISAFARLNLEHVVDDVNDETLDPWAELQEKAGISKANPNPLSPFMEKEILKDTDLSLDGSLFVKETGFE